MHVYNYVFVQGTNHASLKFLHTIEPKIRGMMQVPRLQWPSVRSNDTACTSVSHSVTLRLSVSAVCFNAICRCRLPIRLAVYLQHQTVDPVCIWRLMCYSVYASEWCHSGALCQGGEPRCHHQIFFFFNSRLVPFSCHWTPSCLGFFFFFPRECMHKSWPRRMRCECKHRYALMHIRWRGKKDATL